MIDYTKITKIQNDIKELKLKLSSEMNARKRELLKYKIAIAEIKVKIERLK